MLIGGLQQLTLIDYPGKLAATVFLAGCDFRCPWCYSSEIVLPEKIAKHPKISERELFKFLKSKEGLLEGVVVCGGEPFLNKDLPKFVKNIKKLGLAVKVDTNGSFPETLKRLIDEKLIDYAAMDIKAPKEKYETLVGRKINIKNIERSVALLMENRVDYEFRTTVVPDLLKKEDILKIARWISGAKRYYLQTFRPEKNLDPKFQEIKPYSEKYLLAIQKAVSPFFEVCRVR